MDAYQVFLAEKAIRVAPRGLTDIPDFPPAMKPFQRAVTELSLRRGRSAIFAGTGLGKTLKQLSWSKAISEHEGGPVLVLAPLAVAHQTVGEAEKFSIPSVAYAADRGGQSSDIVVTNYDRIENFDVSQFAGIVLDESSILKAHDSKTRMLLTDICRSIPFKLCCTATPAPNDYVEIGNHSEFLGILSQKEMLATWFVHDGSMRATNEQNHGAKPVAEWRLKRHAEDAFWTWLASWSVMYRHPRDLGFDEPGYDLPPLLKHQVIVEAPAAVPDGELFPVKRMASTLSERLGARRDTIEQRVRAAAEIVNASPDRPWLVWCNLNAEAEALAKAIPGAIDVCGSDSQAYKVAAAKWFTGAICRCQLPKRGGHTTASGSKKTKSTSKIIGTKLQLNAVLDSASCTRQNPSDGDVQSLLQRSNGKQTQRQTSQIGLDTSESVLTNSSLYLKGKEGAVPFADGQNLPTEQSSDLRQENVDCTSITVTKHVLCEDCSVQPATLGLESSATIPSSSNGLRCTCAPEPYRVLISKPSIFGWGLNFQICADMVFVGLNDSFEQLFQAIRRCWRFGQTRPVNAHLIASDVEGAVVANLDFKEQAFERMADAMAAKMKDLSARAIRDLDVAPISIVPQIEMQVPSWMVTA